jgi:hypothetical protein
MLKNFTGGSLNTDMALQGVKSDEKLFSLKSIVSTPNPGYQYVNELRIYIKRVGVSHFFGKFFFTLNALCRRYLSFLPTPGMVGYSMHILKQIS